VGLIKACLNGARAPSEHRALPLTARQLAIAGAGAVAAGAQALHIHPRDADGRETLAVNLAVRAVQAACPGVPVGVSTGAWIVPDVAARVAAVRAWEAPSMASVNLSEDGHAEVMAALEAARIGIEAGLWQVQDVAALQASGFADKLTRVLVEPAEEDPAAAVATAAAIDDALDAAGIDAPRVHHGFDLATWEVLRRAKALGHGWRVGFEDTLVLPDGREAASNAELVSAALAL
jgi:uncharacterized protein (DUF849 family)